MLSLYDRRVKLSNDPSITNFNHHQYNDISNQLFNYRLSVESLFKLGYPVLMNDKEKTAIYFQQSNTFNKKLENSKLIEPYDRKLLQRTCVRCLNKFIVKLHDGEYVDGDVCFYHLGKVKKGLWECCGNLSNEEYCRVGMRHVWLGVEKGINGPFNDFVVTKDAKIRYDYATNVKKIYGIDCEMVYTKRGLVVAKVTLVDINGNVVYDSLVKIDDQILDYNMSFSGIDKNIMKKATKNLTTVQKELLEFVSAQTLLIGHSLENDLRRLKIIHGNILDVSILYPHEKGLPFKYSLKYLASKILRQSIQDSQHDSAEDARTAVNLAISYCNNKKFVSNQVFFF